MGSPGRGTLLYKHSLSVFSKSGSLRLQPRGQPYNLTHWRLYVRDYSPFHLAFSALLLACISSFFYISSFFLISSFSSISSFYCTFNYLNFLVFNFTILVFLGTSSFTYTFPAILALLGIPPEDPPGSQGLPLQYTVGRRPCSHCSRLGGCSWGMSP